MNDDVKAGTQPLRFGLTQPGPCSYLPGQQEQLVVLMPEQPISPELYQQLLNLNFRRSGEQSYTPHCPACQACQSVRINPTLWQPSRSQRRLQNKATRANLAYRLVTTADIADYYPLFAAYIAFKHDDGIMYPATEEQLSGMLKCSWLSIRFLEIYDDQQLVSVSIIDELADSYSAVYTFFARQYQQYSPGKLAIMYLLERARQDNKAFVYLGYLVEACQKMAYKAEFRPQQRFIRGHWHSFA
ncbi:MAG: arginyltransferase [Rheinheimera sp.]|uniref:arginyltransferase n=1 Tax=Arsukibacterium sp. UBA3155 TaxID=1946058 RepID=UPI000C8B659A|nr:arginyltransferase [Arsukibacterium sp. UBA3155]MAD74608.1 arginyltransferase [Rheinheimera sp.]|tara:strand:+ start:39385 stop:40113 length:729 start_codon:yes stop_codon:yes gene_type:complete